MILCTHGMHSHDAILCHTVLYHEYYFILYGNYVMPYCTMLYYMILCYTMLYCVVLCSTMLYYVILCGTVLYHVVLCDTIL